MGQRSEMPVSTDLDHPSDLVKKQQRILSNWKKLTAGLLKGRAKQTFARMQKENHETALQKLEQDSRTLRKRIFGIGPSNHSMPTSRLVYPLSPFGVSWLVLTAILLAYTAIVTPPVISFHWLDPPCVRVPTMEMDMFVDVFFLLDIILNFNMGRLGERSGAAANMTTIDGLSASDICGVFSCLTWSRRFRCPLWSSARCSSAPAPANRTEARQTSICAWYGL